MRVIRALVFPFVFLCCLWVSTIRWCFPVAIPAAYDAGKPGLYESNKGDTNYSELESAIVPVASATDVPPNLQSASDSSFGTRKIAILSYNNGKAGHKFLSDPALARMVRCNHQAYARKHGYDYISPDRESTAWSASRFILNGLRYKTFSILSNFESYDIIVWIDHDALFFNHDIPVEYWLDDVMKPETDLLMAEDLPGYKFNAGLQVIRTTMWARKFYESAIGDILKTPLDASYLEQPIFYRLYDTLEGAAEKIQIHRPRNEFQAFLKVNTDFKNSSWVVHGTFCEKCDLREYLKPATCAVKSHFHDNEDSTIVGDPSGQHTTSHAQRRAQSQLPVTEETSQLVNVSPPNNMEPHTAVCLSGAARTFTTSLSLETIKAALGTLDHLDIFCVLTNDFLGKETNSKGVTYPPIDDDTIRLASDILTQRSKNGNCELRSPVDDEESIITCSFGAAGDKKFDLSEETAAVRQGSPLIKRNKCFQLILQTEKRISGQIGSDWTYDTIISLRPDIFFYRPLSLNHFSSKVPVFPAPAHTAPLGPHVKYFPNDHIAILPRAYAKKYFDLANIFLNCTSTSSDSPHIVDLISKYFSDVEIDVKTVVPYSLNRPGNDVDHCKRVTYYALNIEKRDAEFWRSECRNFITWFFAEGQKGRNSVQVTNFWREQSGV